MGHLTHSYILNRNYEVHPGKSCAMSYHSQHSRPLINQRDEPKPIKRWGPWTRIFSIWNLFFMGLALAVSVCVMEIKRNNWENLGASLTQKHVENRNILVDQFKVSSPDRDICEDPVGFYCGRFNDTYELPEEVTIQTWGFTQIEDKMRKASETSLNLSCHSALADKSLDEWSRFKVCSMDLCKMDGKNDPSIVGSRSDDSDKLEILRHYLPILTTPVDILLSLGSPISNDPTYISFISEAVAQLHNLGRYPLFNLQTKADVLFQNGLNNLKVLGGDLYYPNRAQYEDSAALKTLAEHHKRLFKYYFENMHQTPTSKVVFFEDRLLNVILLERRLARVTLSQEAKRDKYATNNISDVISLKRSLQFVLDAGAYVSLRNSKNLSLFFEEDSNPVIHEDLKYLSKLAEVIQTTPKLVIVHFAPKEQAEKSFVPRNVSTICPFSHANTHALTLTHANTRQTYSSRQTNGEHPLISSAS